MKQLFTLSLIFYSFFSWSQDNSTYPEMPYASFSSIDVHEDIIVIRAFCGGTWISKDAGTSWTTDNQYMSVHDIEILPTDPENKALIGTIGGPVLYDYTNGIEETFETIEPKLNSRVVSLEIIEDEAYVFNKLGIFSAKLDNLNEWTHLWEKEDNNDYPSTTSVTDNYIYLGMRRGDILRYDRSTKQVSTIQEQDGWVYDIEMISDEEGFIYQQGESLLLKTTDGFASTTELENMSAKNIAISESGEMVYTNGLRLVYSTDNGETSTTLYLDSDPNISSLKNTYFSDDGKLYILGDGAMIATSDDLGETLTYITPANRSQLNAVDINQNGIGYAVGHNSTVIKTTDNGESWSESPMSLSSALPLLDVVTFNDGTALATTAMGLRKIEGNTITPIGEATLPVLHHHRALDYLLSTQKYDGVNNIVRSTDNGITWQPMLTIASIYGNFNQPNPDGPIHYTDSSVTYFSNDQGLTWQEMNNINDIQQIKSVLYWDDLTGLIVAGADLLKTVDGGENFTEIASGYLLGNVNMISPDQYIYTTNTNNATSSRETVNGGDTFFSLFNNCITTNDIEVLPSGKIVYAQDAGHINVASLSTVTSIKESKFNAAVKYFPNPVQSGSTITFDRNYDIIEIFDLAGTLLKSIANQKEIQTNALIPGMYILNVNKGESTTSQKLIIY